MPAPSPNTCFLAVNLPPYDPSAGITLPTASVALFGAAPGQPVLFDLADPLDVEWLDSIETEMLANKETARLGLADVAPELTAGKLSCRQWLGLRIRLATFPPDKQADLVVNFCESSMPVVAKEAGYRAEGERSRLQEWLLPEGRGCA